MNLNIHNEWGNLRSVVVCWGYSVPQYQNYRTDDPEFLKFHPYSWDKNLLLKQQENFFKLLEKYQVKLVFPQTDVDLPWQMYTRDTAFVIGQKIYYAQDRKFGERNGEIDKLFASLHLSVDQIIGLDGEIEGGDVLISDSNTCYVGHSSRTDTAAIQALSTHVQVNSLELGDLVMHLDTRFTLLPNNNALIYPPSFDSQQLDLLSRKYHFIEVNSEEVQKLGTNVFIINPQTIVVPTQYSRLAQLLTTAKFKVESIDYTEPINLGGSFRCTTLPLERG